MARWAEKPASSQCNVRLCETRYSTTSLRLGQCGQIHETLKGSHRLALQLQIYALVNRAISISGRQVIPLGTPAYGEVTSAVDSGGLGKTGKMSAHLLHIDLDGVEIPLDGETSAKGTGAGSAGVAVLFAGLAGLFHRGNNAKIKAGEIIAGFVAEDVTLAVSTTTARRATDLAPR